MASEWKKAKDVLHRLNENGFDAYIVGGAVRDYLLKRKVADIDIVTTATPDEVSRLFSKTYRMNNLHQTVIVKHGDEKYEVTTIRGVTIIDDVSLRDLTINSLLMDCNGEVFDFVRGQDDLFQNVLRACEPFDRMIEDPLRMLRVFRFVSELGFDIDQELLSIISTNHERIQDVAIERVIKEWIKLLKGKHRNLALDLIMSTCLFKSIPGLELTEQALDGLSNVKSLKQSTDTVCLTAFCLCLSRINEQYLKNLALSNEQVKKIQARLFYYELRHKKQWNRLDLYDASIQVAIDVENLRNLYNKENQNIAQLLEMWESLPIHQRSELAISGRDLIHALKKNQGPWVKEALMLAEQLVVTGQCQNEKEVLLNAILEEG
ncbi:CCA tRNA nucleotidyltransferase [Halalkalibacter okhensis]|uniref:CCA tRNA nucleotidyltransferase n=1 Tax=Halalkalibacter okhensis TaxID=333138 RepID=A0A0B0IJT4_9BACI|nr:CCA tRNA nucleotidyltransferase [Halalkalibacter okhensis]KHF40309.1 hypothetical protein LQ50_09950 [Halalkalibacter okhensis]